MATLDSSLRPRWVFETLRLWQPNTSVPVLIERATEMTAQELDSPNARLRAVQQIVRFYIDWNGWGRRRRTLAQNVWAAYCRGYGEHALAPAFLLHLAAAVEIGEAAGDFIRQQSRRNDPFSVAQLRSYLARQEPQHPFSGSVPGLWLRTLTYFRVLHRGERAGEYGVRRPLPVAGNLFPLLIYSWLGRRHTTHGETFVRCIDPVCFAADPLMAYVDGDGFDHYWERFAGLLWFREVRLGDSKAPTPGDNGPGFCWRLRYPDPTDFARALINLLAPYRHPRRYRAGHARPTGEAGHVSLKKPPGPHSSAQVEAGSHFRPGPRYRPASAKE